MSSSILISNTTNSSPSSETNVNPLHIPYREWELGENSTIFDNLRAAPSDETIIIQWIILVSISVIALVFMLIVFLAILQDKRCRQHCFNVYILYLMVPGILFTGLSIVTCSLNIASGKFISTNHCAFQSFYSVFSVCASSWLNAIIAWQLHKMLVCGRNLKRYHAPNRMRAMHHSLVVMAWSAFVASWTMWNVDWWPISNGLYGGAFCLPMATDEKSLAFLCGVFGPCCFTLPFLFICYTVINILWKGLLPPKAKRKRLLIFFGLILVYFFIWIPSIFLTYILGYWLNSWSTCLGAVGGISQGFISAAVCLLKEDIRLACREFVGWKEDASNATATTKGRSLPRDKTYSFSNEFKISGLDLTSLNSNSMAEPPSMRSGSYHQSNTNNQSASFNNHSFSTGSHHHPHRLSTSFNTIESETVDEDKSLHVIEEGDGTLLLSPIHDENDDSSEENDDDSFALPEEPIDDDDDKEEEDRTKIFKGSAN